jgi:hypothetical protein
MINTTMTSAAAAAVIRKTKKHRSAAARMDSLESRLMFYALSGSEWASGNISVSLMPDGTALDSGYTSALFADLNAQHRTDVWQREFARALQSSSQRCSSSPVFSRVRARRES